MHTTQTLPTPSNRPAAPTSEEHASVVHDRHPDEYTRVADLLTEESDTADGIKSLMTPSGTIYGTHEWSEHHKAAKVKVREFIRAVRAWRETGTPYPHELGEEAVRMCQAAGVSLILLAVNGAPEHAYKATPHDLMRFCHEFIDDGSCRVWQVTLGVPAWAPTTEWLSSGYKDNAGGSWGECIPVDFEDMGI